MFKKMIALIFLTSLSVNMCGCVPLLVAGGAVAGGAGTATWFSGKLTQEVDASFDDTIQAAESALYALGLDITRKAKKERVAQIISHYTNEKTVWIDIHRISQSTSRVAVRVGALPDKVATRKILDKIKEYLNGRLRSSTEKKSEMITEKKAEKITVDEPEVIVMEDLK